MTDTQFFDFSQTPARSSLNDLIPSNFIHRRLQSTAGTVFYYAEQQTDLELSKLEDEHKIVPIGRKDAMKLGIFFAKNSPLKPMFDQV